MSDRHGYDGLCGFYAYGQHALIDSSTLYFAPGFLKHPPAGWTVDGFNSTLAAEAKGILVRHLDPVRVWRLTGNIDAPYPGYFGYQAIWPD